MNKYDKVYSIVDSLRKEQFHLFSLRHNCIGKSFRLKKACRGLGVNVRVVISLSLILNLRFQFLPPALPLIHGWAEVEGMRVELARPLTETNSIRSYDTDIVPFIAVWV